MEQLELDFREWRPIKDYEGLYDLRSDGLLYTYPRPRTKGGYNYGGKSNKYLKFSLSKEGKVKSILAHRLVYEVFIGQIPDGYDVHHKNHNPKDNRVENLELIELHKHRKNHYEENKTELIKKKVNKTSKPVLQYTKSMELVAEYKSAQEAEKITGINQGNISMCCNGRYGYKTAGGFIWKFKD